MTIVKARGFAMTISFAIFAMPPEIAWLTPKDQAAPVVTARIAEALEEAVPNGTALDEGARDAIALVEAARGGIAQAVPALDVAETVIPETMTAVVRGMECHRVR